MKTRFMKIVVAISVAVLILTACSSHEEKKQSFYEKGKAYYDQKDYVKSRLALKNAIQIDPKFSEAYYLLGEVELQDKAAKKAFNYLSKAVELNEGLLDAQVALGKIFLIVKEVEKAQSKYTYVLDRVPDHKGGRLLKAGVLMALQKTDQAGQLLEKLLTEGMTEPRCYIMLASIQLRQGDRAESQVTLRNGITSNPENTRLRELLTAFHVKDKKYDTAITLMKEVIAIEPDNPSYKLKLASIYWDANRPNDVESLFQQMVAEDDDPGMVRSLAADFYVRKKNTNAALAVLNEGIKAEPKNIKLHLSLARLQMAMRAYDAAAGTMNGALNLTKDEANPDLLKVKNQLARLCLGKGQFDKAKQYTDQVIAVSGRNVDAQFIAGQIYLQKKEGLNAVSAFRTVVAEKPNAVDGYLYLAQAHILSREKQLALSTLANGLSANPDSPPLHKAIARIHAADKNYADAEKELRHIVQKNPNDVRASIELGDFLFSMKRQEEAIAIYQKMVKEQPKVPAGYLKLAALFRAQKNQKATLTIMEKGYEVTPNSVPMITALVKTYLSQSNHDKAISLLQNRLKTNGQDILAHNLMGEIFMSRKQFFDAETSFKSAIAIEPDWQPPHNNLARIYLAQGKKDEAIANLTSALENNPKNAAAYMTLGQLYQSDGDDEKVIDIYEKALEALPNLWPAANNLAFLLAQNGGGKEDLDRAHALARQAFALHPEKTNIIDTLGWVHYLRGETDMAIAELEKAAARTPDSAMVNYHLGMALKKANRLGEARELLEKAISHKDFSERQDAQKALQELQAV